jgi:hypothetical protein
MSTISLVDCKKFHPIYRMVQEEKSILWDVIVSVILRKKGMYIYTYMCPIPNGFRYSDFSLYSSEIFDKKKILRNVSNTGIYHSSGKVGTVYLVYL